MKHTPGNWEADFTDTNGHLGWSIDAETRRVATVYARIVQSPRPEGGEYNIPENAESIVNARLIAAAPDLLEALEKAKGVVEFMATAIDSDPDDHELLELVNNAIAKATA